MPKTTKAAKGGKRHPLNMRTTKEIRARLEKAATANGRSLAQEVEVRLAQSFEGSEQFGGDVMMPVVRLMAAAFIKGGQAEARRKGIDPAVENWIDDPECFHDAVVSTTFGLRGASWALDQSESWNSDIVKSVREKNEKVTELLKQTSKKKEKSS